VSARLLPPDAPHRRADCRRYHRADFAKQLALTGYQGPQRISTFGPQFLASCSRRGFRVVAPRGIRRAHSYEHDLTHDLKLIGVNLDRAAVQLGHSGSWGATFRSRRAHVQLGTSSCTGGYELMYRRARSWLACLSSLHGSTLRLRAAMRSPQFAGQTTSVRITRGSSPACLRGRTKGTRVRRGGRGGGPCCARSACSRSFTSSARVV
jgi:hypothetical protein